MSTESKANMLRNVPAGEYHFFAESYGNITLEVITNDDSYLPSGMKLSKEVEVENEDGEKEKKVIPVKTSFGIDVDSAISGFSKDERTLLEEFAFERQLNPGEVVWITHIRSAMSMNERRRLARTGQIPAWCAVTKSDLV